MIKKSKDLILSKRTCLDFVSVENNEQLELAANELERLILTRFGGSDELILFIGGVEVTHGGGTVMFPDGDMGDGAESVFTDHGEVLFRIDAATLQRGIDMIL